MNLAYVSPLPPLRSGVADYSAALLPHLRPFFERILAVADGYVPDLPAGLVDAVVDSPTGADWWSGGERVPLYHMGCHAEYHRYVYSALRRWPGITVLHDGNLLPFIHDLTLARNDRAGYLREAAFEGGAEGARAGWAALRHAQPLAADAHLMLARVARASLGVLVHSRCARDRVLRSFPWARVGVVPHLDLMPGDLHSVSRRDLKAALGFAPDSLLVGAFGIVAPSKRLDLALKAFARLRGAFPAARFVCVGEVTPGYRFERLVDRLHLRHVVRLASHQPLEALTQYLQAVDVGVNLRWPTWGESSGALVRLMRCGVPTLVTDAGAFAELPDEAVVKVPLDVDEVALEVAMGALLADPEARERIGRAARKYVAERCAPRAVAEAYAAFIGAAVNGAPLSDGVPATN